MRLTKINLFSFIFWGIILILTVTRKISWWIFILFGLYSIEIKIEL